MRTLSPLAVAANPDRFHLKFSGRQSPSNLVPSTRKSLIKKVVANIKQNQDVRKILNQSVNLNQNFMRISSGSPCGGRGSPKVKLSVRDVMKMTEAEKVAPAPKNDARPQQQSHANVRDVVREA